MEIGPTRTGVGLQKRKPKARAEVGEGSAEVCGAETEILGNRLLVPLCKSDGQEVQKRGFSWSPGSPGRGERNDFLPCLEPCPKILGVIGACFLGPKDPKEKTPLGPIIPFPLSEMIVLLFLVLLFPPWLCYVGNCHFLLLAVLVLSLLVMKMWTLGLGALCNSEKEIQGAIEKVALRVWNRGSYYKKIVSNERVFIALELKFRHFGNVT